MTKQKNIEGEDAWEEIESPNFFQFKEVGDSLEGTLIDRGKSDQYGFGLYTLEKDDGDQIRFHGSSQLDDLMLNIHMNETIKIKFMDIEARPKGDMHLFSVKRKR